MTVNASSSIELGGFIPPGNVSRIDTTTLSTSNAGSIAISTTRLTVSDGGRIGSATIAEGNAGATIIRASEAIHLTGPTNILPSAIFSGALNARDLEDIDALPPDSPPMASGNSGSLWVTTEQLLVSEGAEVSVANDGIGVAGDINLTTNRLLLLEAPRGINAQTASGNGGNIHISTDLLQLNRDSQITARAGNGGNGGNIAIDAEATALLGNSSINANAFEGNGGNIEIATQGLFQSADSRITASSNFGLAGTVRVDTPNINPSSGLVELPREAIDPSEQITTVCASERSSSFAVNGRGGLPENTLSNTLTITGRGGLPPNPVRQLISNRPWVDLRDLSAFQEENTPRRSQQVPVTKKLVEANGWIVRPDGHMELVAFAGHLQKLPLPFNCAAKLFVNP